MSSWALGGMSSTATSSGSVLHPIRLECCGDEEVGFVDCDSILRGSG